MMSHFAYRAARPDGAIETGALIAADRAAAAAELASRGLVPTRLDATNRSSERSRLSSSDLAIGLRTLSTLLGAGLSVPRAIDAFEDVAPPAWRGTIQAAALRVRQGSCLADALAHGPSNIPPMLIGIVRAGENAGGLDSAIARAADVAEAGARLRAAIRSALAYPAVLAVVGGASITVVVGVILPRFAQLLSDSGTQMPTLARMTLGAGGVIHKLWWPVVLMFLATLAVWRAWITNPESNRVWHESLRHLPIAGELRIIAASGRTCGTLGALLHSGVPIAAALEHASEATGDLAVRSRMIQARERVLAGARLSVALSDQNVVTPTARRLIRAGEESGQLAAMLARAAELDTDRLSSRLNTLVRLLEPALIISFAGVIALVAASLLQAIYAVRPT